MMPNQLSDTKVRKSITENQAVIAIFNEIAKEKNVSFTDLVRISMRDMIRSNIDLVLKKSVVKEIIKEFKPLLSVVKTSEELSKYKKMQREFDEILLDLNIENKNEIQNCNSIIPSDTIIKVMDF